MAEKYVDNTFPFAGINRIRFKGFYLSRFLTISTPKVYVFKYKGIYREIKVYASLNSFFMPLTRFLYSAGPSAKLKLHRFGQDVIDPIALMLYLFSTVI